MLDTEAANFKTLHANTSLSKDEKHAQFKSIFQATAKQIEGVLNPDQLAKFQQFHHHHHDGAPQQQEPPQTT